MYYSPSTVRRGEIMMNFASGAWVGYVKVYSAPYTLPGPTVEPSRSGWHSVQFVSRPSGPPSLLVVPGDQLEGKPAALCRARDSRARQWPVSADQPHPSPCCRMLANLLRSPGRRLKWLRVPDLPGFGLRDIYH